MPYYTRPDGTREVELPDGRRIVTMMSPQELQARGIMPAQMSGGESPMSMQPEPVSSLPDLQPGTKELASYNRSNPYRGPANFGGYGGGPGSPSGGQRGSSGADREVLGIEQDLVNIDNERDKEAAGASAAVDREQDYLNRRIQELEDELSRLREQAKTKKG